MTPHITSTVVALKTISLVLGGLITYFSYKAYRRTNSQPLWFLSIGFAIVTIGALLAGVVDRLLPYAPTSALLIESSTTTIGFAVIVYSLYAE
ncbi:MAG: hypothetical protein ABEI96_09495 [Haloarculaceae archaeon]